MMSSRPKPTRWDRYLTIQTDDPVLQQRGLVFLRILAVFHISNLLYAVILSHTFENFFEGVFILGLTQTLYALAVFLTRRGRVYFAATMISMFLSVLLIAVTLNNDKLGTELFFLCLPITIAGISLPMRRVLAISGVVLLEIVLLMFVFPESASPLPNFLPLLLFPLSLLGAGAALGAQQVERSTLRALQLQKVERERREEIEQRLRAEQASDQKSRFLASMTHELRTPLTSILGYSELLLEEVEDHPQDDFTQNLGEDLTRIRQAGAHLLCLVNDILDLSKIESGHMTVEHSWFDAAALLEEVLGPLQEHIEQRGNRLTTSCSHDYIPMYSDPTKMRQILLNLLSNANKFTDHGDIHVRVIHDAQEELLMWEVEDTGIGMTPEQLSRVFSEFEQADNSTSREYGGTGLGLPLSRGLCHLLDGTMEVESVAGQGSRFRVMFQASSEEMRAMSSNIDSLRLHA